MDTPCEYGATIASDKPKRVPSESLQCYAFLGCIFLPTVVFIVICYIRCLEIHYESSALSLLICILILFVMCPMCVPMWSSSTPTRRRLFAFLLLSCILAWVLGFLWGDMNYHAHFKPYLDMKNLNTYPHVNPTVYYATQYMDAAVIEFVPGSHLDLEKSYGFKNGDIYCIAPIVGPTTPGNFTGIGKRDYDFWAVGLNCCSGHRPDFHCGEYSNPRASKGLRLMHEEQHDYFRLAAQAAQAAYDIRVRQPIFMYWMEYPDDEIHVYVEDGWKCFAHGVFAYLVLQIFLMVIAVVRCI